MSRMRGDAGEDIAQPCLRIDPVHFCRDDQAIHGRGASSSAIRSAEEPGFSSKSYASQPPFGSVVGETYAPILKEQSEARPSLQDVVECLGQVVPTGELGELLSHIDLQILHQGAAQSLPNLQAPLGTLAID